MTDERRQYITKVVFDAMDALSAKYPDVPFDDRPASPICIVNWTLQSPEKAACWAELEEAVARYVEGNGNVPEVTAAYKKYAGLHKQWFYGALKCEAPK